MLDKLNLIKITKPESKEFKEVWKLYLTSFPKDERRTREGMINVLQNKLFSLFGVYEYDILVA